MYASFIMSSLEEVSQIANKKFGKVKGTVKKEDSNQVLTEADIAIGKRLIALIEKNFPNHNIIDEEAGVIDKRSEFTWVIDPVDGTSNFAQGIPLFGIMIGLLYKEEPIAGGVALPSFSEIIIAEKGKGAYCNEEKIQATEEDNLLLTLVAYLIDGHQESPSLTREEVNVMGEIILNIQNLRTSGSVFDSMMVAKGKYGGFLCQTSKIWDNVAQHIIINEAGGIYTDFFGEPINYSNSLKKAKQNFTICAASPRLHKKLQEIIHGVEQKIFDVK